MQIIPVIDLSNGIVVHAKQGNRELYAPLQSGLCKSSDIFDIISAILALFNFPVIYIADLNAITRQGDNAVLIMQVLTAYPQTMFWVDSGYPLNSNFQQHLNFLPILGSESFDDENIAGIKAFNNRFILSLDHSAKGELGAKALFSSHYMWPENIIIMSLPKVGSGLGPDLDKLSAYCKQYPRYNFIAAGGIRDMQDLGRLINIGIKQALVATALHNGTINADDIAELQAKKYPD
jgi:phosphoribosylformimino-5-aminoimidazole carboxamide ribotide isomerase